jgi:hypothetical protein
MRLLPRNVAAEGVPEKPAGRGEVVRRYEITVEREFLAVRSQADLSFAAFCPQCGHNVNMMHPDAAAAAGGTTTRNIYRWSEQGRVHFIEPESGLLFVCSESLQRLSPALEAPASPDADTPKEDAR